MREAPPSRPLASAPRVDPAPPPRAAAGALRFGPYVAERPLGRGATGIVYRARDTRSDRLVALKLLALHGAVADEDFADARERFLSEAAIARRLEHPDIVRVFDAGEQRGQAWMAMELVAGCDLSRYTAAARLLPEPLVLEIGARLARALGAAHRLGIVHRDVKPSNVRVDLAAGRVKLADFGAARLQDLQRTRTGAMLGTPAYMAPEQLAGHPADAASDLYALAAMLYELLSGHLPHGTAALGELLRRIASDAPPPLASLRPDLPRTLSDLLARALAIAPANRHPGAEALAEALDSVRAQLPPAGGGPGASTASRQR